MAKQENLVQQAIAGALQVHCNPKKLQIFQPYANQQGGKLHQYCGDLFGLMDGADMIALEVKELEVAQGTLKKFDANQHREAHEFAKLGVPLAYAYNAIELEQLPYYRVPQPSDWSEKTLASINRSRPKPLPGPRPDVAGHQSLLDWLNASHAANGYELFGRLHGAIKKVGDLRNGMLVLMYAVSTNTLATLTAAQVDIAVRTLTRGKANLDDAQRAKLNFILQASDDVFKRFSPPPSAAPAPRSGQHASPSGGQASPDDSSSDQSGPRI